LADGYFVIPYTLGDYLSHDIQTPKINVNCAEFDKAEKDVKDKINKILNIKGKKSVDEIHKQLGIIMWDNVGMARTAESLERATKLIAEVKKEFWTNVFVPGVAEDFNQELEKALRLADFLEIGALMALDGLNRNESCGGHFRMEYQTPDGEALRNDEEYTYVAVWEYQGEDKKPVLHKEDLVFENIKVAQRNYKE
ncbi:MAG: fumarate reductase/succinate dehydrogenase flavoprotein subunit, partial [Rikenellaceae bacterium]